MAIFQNQKQIEEYMPGLLLDLPTKTSVDCWFYQGIVHSLIDVEWQRFLKELVNDKMWEKDEEKQKVIAKLLRCLQSNPISQLINDNDLEFIKTFQDTEGEEREEAQFVRSDGSVAQISYDPESRKLKNKIKQQKYRDALRLSYKGGDNITQDKTNDL